jgi:glycosyltransferase involved in cell wall biosynthesis
MNIVHLVTNLEKGGITLSLLQNVMLSDRSKNNTAIVHGVSNDEESTMQLQVRLEGFEFIRIPSLKAGIRPINDLLTIQRLINIFKERKIDLLHTHGAKALIIGKITAKLCNIKNLCHTPYGQLSWKHEGFAVSTTIKASRWFLKGQNNHYIALSENEKQNILKLAISEENCIHVVRGGIDLKRAGSTGRADARVRLNIRDNTFVICTVARFTEEKNHDVLLETARILRSARVPYLWLFLGDGERFHSFRRMAQTSGLIEKFFFAGWIEDIHTFLPACDVFCLSPFSEPLGRAFIEAQSEGLPIVASRVGCIPEIVMNRKSGFLHPPDDPNALAGSLKKLYDETALRHTMGDEAKAHVSTGFSAEGIVKRMEALYESIAAKSTV